MLKVEIRRRLCFYKLVLSAVGLGAYLFFPLMGMDLKSLSLIVAPHFPSQGGSMPRGKGTDHLAITVSWLPSRCLALALVTIFWARIAVLGLLSLEKKSKIQTSKNHSREKPGKGNWCSWIKGQSASEMEQMHSSIMKDRFEKFSGLSLRTCLGWAFRWDHLAPCCWTAQRRGSREWR